MNKTKITTIVGTRPEIIRLSAIIKKLDQVFDHRLIHTGQNPAPELNKVFFKDLNLRLPDVEFDIAPGSLATYLSKMLPLIEQEFIQNKPDGIVILGDTNSALSAIIAKRLGITIYHLEAGNRSFDFNVPEEINRRIVDHIADFNLPYSEIARQNLLDEGLHPRYISKMGSPMFEVLNNNKSEIESSNVLQMLNLKEKEFILASIHRQENVDFGKRLSEILDALDYISINFDLPVMISTHPRTKIQLKKQVQDFKGRLIFHEPFGFNDYICLQKNARIVISDSGTISEESAILGFPAVTIRNSMERPEAMEAGAICLGGINKREILEAVNYVLTKKKINGIPDEYFYPIVSERVVNLIVSTVNQAPKWKGLYSKADPA